MLVRPEMGWSIRPGSTRPPATISFPAVALITAWRLTSEEHASGVFSGEGARLFGGRWNTKGTPVCYLADTPALCQLEVLANTRDYRQLRAKVLFRARFEEEHLTVLSGDELPSGWQARPPGASSKRVGDEWIREGRSVALRVPSALDPHGANYLLNPRHPAFPEEVEISEGRTYQIDPRLAEGNEA